MKYYIVRNIAGTTLFFDGENFQEYRSRAAIYEHDEALQEIEDKDLQYSELQPVNVFIDFQRDIFTHMGL